MPHRPTPTIQGWSILDPPGHQHRTGKHIPTQATTTDRPTVLLDHPVIPPAEQTRNVAHRLLETGPLLWGDLTYWAQDQRHWIPVAAFHRLRLSIPYPTEPCPQEPYVNCRGGQFWSLRSCPGSSGGIYELLNFPSQADDSLAIIYYRRWIGCTTFCTARKDRAFPTPGHRFKPTHSLTGGGVSWSDYLTVQQFQARAHARLLTCTGPRGSRILLHTICEPPVYRSAGQPPQELVKTLRPLLASAHSWDVYVDGSWYPLPSSAASLLGEAETHTGLIFVPTSEPFSSGIVIIRMNARSLSTVHGGGGQTTARPLYGGKTQPTVDRRSYCRISVADTLAMADSGRSRQCVRHREGAL